MPLYEYKCDRCGGVFEVIEKFSASPLQQHEGCGGHVERLLSVSALQFKGTGWYVTDYARNSGSGNGKSKNESKGDSKNDSKNESKGDSKSESKSDSKSESKSDQKSEPSKSFNSSSTSDKK